MQLDLLDNLCYYVPCQNLFFCYLPNKKHFVGKDPRKTKAWVEAKKWLLLGWDWIYQSFQKTMKMTKKDFFLFQMTSNLSPEARNRFSLKKYESRYVTLVCSDEKWRIYSIFLQNGGHLGFFLTAVKTLPLNRFQLFFHFCTSFFGLNILSTNLINFYQK